MWLSLVSLYLLIFYGHTSSQPVSDDSENARQARQLDFGECCPCPSTGQRFDGQESAMFRGADGSYVRVRDQDDCPCRDRNADSEGASSIFFPTSVRSDGSALRPADKKDDLKPLLHPEVDLASSVLQTLREATDEEYRDALARDAARSIAKAAEENLFGDAVPEASNGNIVTIIVKPKQTNTLDDIIPQESHNQESRCIHAPLESQRANLGKMRVATKPNLLRDIFGLPRKSKTAGLLHRNSLDMDSGMGATNIQEFVVPIDEDQVTNKSKQGSRKYVPSKFNTNLNGKSTDIQSGTDDDSHIIKRPDYKLPSMKNKLNDLISNRSSLEGITKKNTLSSISKLKLNYSLAKGKEKNIEDLSLSPSNIEEQAKLSFLQAKSHLENILQKSRPVGLKNLLKLKDVELIPLKDLVNKASEKSIINKPSFAYPNIFNKGDDLISINKDEYPVNIKSTEITDKIQINSEDEMLDHEVSPSNTIEKTSEDNCLNEGFKTATGVEVNVEDMKDKITATKDTSSDLEITKTNNRDIPSNDLVDNTDDCNIETLPITEINPSQSMESSVDDEIPGTNKGELNSDTSQEPTPDFATDEESKKTESILKDDCISNYKDPDSSTDSSNNMNNYVEPDDTSIENVDSVVNKNDPIEESCSHEQQAEDNLRTSDITTQKKLIKPLSLDETFSTIKENIIKTIENLKVPKAASKNAKIFIPSNDIENRESSTMPEEKQNSHCTNEESIQVTTSQPTDGCEDNLENNNESSEQVSMQDLQKMSDEMLQREEQQQESKFLHCSEPSQKVTDAKVEEDPTINAIDIENMEAEKSANSQNEVVMDPQNIVEIGDNNEKTTCESNLMLPKQASEQDTDANAEPSEVVINSAPQISDIMGLPLSVNKVLESKENSLFDNPIPDIQDVIKLAPLPTLDEIKLKLTDLFDKAPREVEECSTSPTEAESMTDPINIIRPIMETDASTSNFQLRTPPLRLDDLNLDILRLNPDQSLISKLPKIDLPSYKTKFQIPDLGLKPVKLQSALEDLTVGRINLWPNDKIRKNLRIPDNQWEIIPDLNNFGNRVKTNTQKIAKSHKPGNLRNSIITSPRIEDLSNDIHSHAKNTLKNMQHTLESKFREATKSPVNLQPEDLLHAISRNHEDVSDKLKALHVDFSDRIETMRNNLFDKSRFGNSESRSKTFSTFSTQNKPKSLTSRREPKKTLKAQRIDQPRSSGVGSSQNFSTQKKFKMPAAASVPVPRTIEVPKLKATLTKSPGPAVQRTSGVIPNTQNMEILQDKEPSVALWKQASKKLYNTNSRLGKQINPFKDSKIKVSFSATPRSTISSRLQSKKKSTRHDFNGSPSDINNSIISAPISSYRNQQKLDKYNTNSESKLAGASFDDPSNKLRGRENVEENVQPTMIKDLQSWPKASESAFLSKVKEAVKARLSKVNSPDSLKQVDVTTWTDKYVGVLNSNPDMTRSASENVDMIEGKVLKENVSYKCTMVCTKE